MYIKELSNKEFNSFKSLTNFNNIYQTIEYGMIMNKQNYSHKIIGLVDDKGSILAGGLILISKKEAYVPRGFIIDYNDYNLLNKFTENLKPFLFKQGIIKITISPLIIKNVYDFKYQISSPNSYFEKTFNNLTSLGYKHLGFNNMFEKNKPRYEAILNLEKPYHTLFNDIKKEYRTKIRSAEANGIEIYKGNENNLEYLYLQTKNKYPRDLNYYKDCYNYYSINNEIDFYYAKLNTELYLKRCTKLYHEQEHLVNELNEKFIYNKNLIEKKMHADKMLTKYKDDLVTATKYLSKYPNGIVLAASLVVKNNNKVYLLIDGYDENYKSLNAKHLLYWKMISKYSEDHFELFNLGGIANPNIKSKYSGLNNFKLGFNSNAYEYIGEFELMCNPKLKKVIKENMIINKIMKKKNR